MKIKHLQAYQGVRFGKSTENFFVATDNGDPGYGNRAARVQFEEHQNGVIVFNEEYVVMVGWANVAALSYDRSTFTPRTESPKPVEKSAKAK